MGNDAVERGAAEETAQAPSAGTRWSRRLLVPFSSLENRDFRLLWFGQLGQASSMWAEQVARSWLTWQLTGSATALGLVNLFRAVPLIALGMLGGVAADRFDKRKISPPRSDRPFPPTSCLDSRQTPRRSLIPMRWPDSGRRSARPDHRARTWRTRCCWGFERPWLRP